jgi:hypothetical protein
MRAPVLRAMSAEAALLILLLFAGPEARAEFRAPLEKGEVADMARDAIRKRGCGNAVVEMGDPASGRERLRAWCRDEPSAPRPAP